MGDDIVLRFMSGACFVSSKVKRHAQPYSAQAVAVGSGEEDPSQLSRGN